MNWKKLCVDLLKVLSGAVAGWLAGGCSCVPVFTF